MQGKRRDYFVCANTARGFVNYFPSALCGMERIFILKGGPGTGKSTLMRKVGEHFLQKGDPAEYIHCSSDAQSLDGVILCRQKAAVVDGTAPHIIEPKAPGLIEDYVNLGTAWDRKKLCARRAEILHCTAVIQKTYDQIYQCLANAKALCDSRNRLYRREADPAAAKIAAEDLTDRIFSDRPPRTDPALALHRFAGALTPYGAIHYTDSLTEDVTMRYFIQGTTADEKSAVMKKIADEAQSRGVDAEIYHNHLDAEQIDMIILRTLGVSLLDTAAYEVFPMRSDDIIWNVSAASDETAAEPKATEPISLTDRMYDEKLEEVKRQLGDVKYRHDQLEKCYIEAVDFTVLDRLTQAIIEEIEKS